MSGVFALKVFCGAGAREACLVQGIPLLSAGKLLGGVHQVGMEKQLGNIQWVRSNTVCAFSPYKNMIFYGVLCLAAQRVFEGVQVVLEEEIIFSSPRGAWRIKRVKESHIWVRSGEKHEDCSSFHKSQQQHLLCQAYFIR